MTAFSFNAIDHNGQRTHGTLESTSQRAAVRQLLKMFLHPTSLEEVGIVAAKTTRIPRLAVCAMFGRLGELLEAGVPLAQALHLLADVTSHTGLKAVLKEVYQSVNDGAELSVAAARHPNVFSPMTVAVIRASLEGGFPAEAMQQLEANMRKQLEMRSQLRGAMVYPVFLCFAGMAMLLALFVFFIPRFAPIFETLEGRDQLPFVTTVMLGFSEFLQAHLLLLGTLAAVLVVTVITAASRSEVRFLVTRTMIQLPHLGRFLVVISLSRFSQLMETLLQNGITLDRALLLCSKVSGNPVLDSLIRDSATSVAQGELLSATLKRASWIPREFQELVMVGEKTNRLPQTLQNISRIYEKQVTNVIDAALKLVEPTLLVGIGLTVATLVFALVLPILRSSSLVG